MKKFLMSVIMVGIAIFASNNIAISSTNNG